MLQLEKQTPDPDSSEQWISELSEHLKFTDRQARPGLRATISCRVVDRQPTLFVPAELAQLQPDVLRYLHALGATNNLALIEDRRTVSVDPITERRTSRPTNLALGVSLMLKQTGMPGPAHGLSKPHILRPDNPKIDLPRLINMVAHVKPGSKKVVFVPNRFLTGDFSEKARPMTGYACKVITHDEHLVLSYFHSPDFHAIGYVSNDQFVIHLLLAGGSIRTPKIWSPPSVLTEGSFRCQIIKSKSRAHDFGLMYSTYYIDLEKSMEEESWWQSLTDPDDVTQLSQRAK